jgi:hypothetical protein
MREQKIPRSGPSERPLRHAISFLDIIQVSQIFIFWFGHVCATLSCVFELTMCACCQPAEKREKRAHNPFTAEEKVRFLNFKRLYVMLS